MFMDVYSKYIKPRKFFIIIIIFFNLLLSISVVYSSSEMMACLQFIFPTCAH